MSKFLAEVLSLVLTAVILSSSIGTADTFQRGKQMTYTIISESSSEYVLEDINSYHYSELNGTSVVSAIRRFQDRFEIVTITKDGVTKYPKADYSIPNLFGTNEYIDPNRIFIGVVYRDANDEVESIYFTDKEIFSGIIAGEDDLEHAKILIVDAIKNGTSTDMSWEEIARILDNLLKDKINSSDEYEALLKQIQEELAEWNKKYYDAVNNNTSKEREQQILDELASIIGFSPSQITAWTELENAISDLKDKVKDMQTQADELNDILNKYPQLVEEFEHLESEIKKNQSVLEDLNKQIKDLENSFPADMDKFIENLAKIEGLEESIRSSTESLRSLEAEYARVEAILKDIKEQLKATLEEIIKTDAEAKDWNDKFEEQLSITNKYTDLYNTELINTKNAIDRYNAQVIIKNQWIATRDAYNNDIANAKVVFKQWLGNLYVEGSVTSIANTTVNSYKNMLTATGVSNALLLDTLNTEMTKAISPMINAIKAKGGYVTGTDLVAVANGVLTIPQNIPPTGTHYHSAACYPGHLHSHTEACKSYYTYDYTCSGCSTYTYKCSGCIKEWYGWVTCPACGGSGTLNGRPCGCSDGKPGGWYEGYRMICNGHTSTTCYGHTGTSYNYICGKNTTTYYTTAGTVAPLSCHLVVTDVSVVRGPIITTARGSASVNTQGMVVMFTYLDNTRKYAGGYNVTGDTSTVGDKTGTLSYSGLINTALNNSTITRTFTYTVK